MDAFKQRASASEASWAKSVSSVGGGGRLACMHEQRMGAPRRRARAAMRARRTVPNCHCLRCAPTHNRRQEEERQLQAILDKQAAAAAAAAAAQCAPAAEPSAPPLEPPPLAKEKKQ